MQLHQRLVITIPASTSVVPFTISVGGISITHPLVVHHPERRIVVESFIGVDQGVDERQVVATPFAVPVRLSDEELLAAERGPVRGLLARSAL